MDTKQIKVELNPVNFGYCARFEHDGVEYYADLCAIYGDTECMIFKVEDGQVNWRELYCKRNIPVSEGELRKCIKEFITDIDYAKY